MRIILKTLIIFFFLNACQKYEQVFNSDVLVFINSNTPSVKMGTEKLVPYLDHFGVKFHTTDLAAEKVPSNLGKYALVVISHPEITAGNNDLTMKLASFLSRGQKEGTGILSFDPLMPGSLLSWQDDKPMEEQDVGELIFSNEKHYITEYHQPGEKKELFGYMSVLKMKKKGGQVLLAGNDYPLLIVSNENPGKVVQWTSQDWMYKSILGPMGGLDDCLWKSIVWAARKPFVMQALPPVVTMRVNNVPGSGRQQWDETPLFWVKTVNKYGFKPWLGLFLYNLTPEGIEELKELTGEGMVTSSPQAFGRPPRPESAKENFEAYYKDQVVDSLMVPDYWYPDAIPLLSDYYDEFIFFDHNSEKPWPDDTAGKILEAVDGWYYKNGPLPKSSYLSPHWGEMGSNMIHHVYDKWNIEFITLGYPDVSWGNQSSLHAAKKEIKPIRRRPFGLYDEPVVGRPKENAITSRATYTADFVEFTGKKFFDFSSAINDITGYEWKPDNDVEATAERGIKTIRRGLEAKALAVLFTHETDYIFRIKPENWEKIFSKISEGISDYDPVFLTKDEALKMVRAFHSSEVQSVSHYIPSGKLKIRITGRADVPTSIYVYHEDDKSIVNKMYEIPPFENELTTIIYLENQ